MLTVDDIITPDKFISLAQNCMSERRNSGIILSPDKNIFFVKTDYIQEFQHKFLPNINYNFVLITHDADNPVQEQHIPILNNCFLKKWFGMNCHIIHDKLQPIPIGIANESWPHGNKQTLLDTANNENQKTGLIYSNFDQNTNLNQRCNVNDALKDVSGIYIEKNKLNYQNYLETLAAFKYVISPPGNSTDCHRIWESIYVNTIPIVLKSVPMLYFKDCPILFINQWSDLHNLDLDNIYYDITKKSKTKSKFSFYRKLIQETLSV
jgi:hypothetical protein